MVSEPPNIIMIMSWASLAGSIAPGRTAVDHKLLEFIARLGDAIAGKVVGRPDRLDLLRAEELIKRCLPLGSGRAIHVVMAAVTGTSSRRRFAYRANAMARNSFKWCYAQAPSPPGPLYVPEPPSMGLDRSGVHTTRRTSTPTAPSTPPSRRHPDPVRRAGTVSTRSGSGLCAPSAPRWR